MNHLTCCLVLAALAGSSSLCFAQEGLPAKPSGTDRSKEDRKQAAQDKQEEVLGDVESNRQPARAEKLAKRIEEVKKNASNRREKISKGATRQRDEAVQAANKLREKHPDDTAQIDAQLEDRLARIDEQTRKRMGELNKEEKQRLRRIEAEPGTGKDGKLEENGLPGKDIAPETGQKDRLLARLEDIKQGGELRVEKIDRELAQRRSAVSEESAHKLAALGPDDADQRAEIEAALAGRLKELDLGAEKKRHAVRDEQKRLTKKVQADLAKLEGGAKVEGIKIKKTEARRPTIEVGSKNPKVKEEGNNQ